MAASSSLQHLRADRAADQQVGDLQRPVAEAANRQHRPVQGQRRDDRVDAAAVGQAGIDHRRVLVDAAADAGHDPLDDLQQVLVVGEDGVRLLQAAEPLDIDLVRAVDQDVADVRVLHVRLERAEAERFGDQLLDQPLFVDRRQLARAGAEHPFGEVADVLAELFVREAGDPRQVERIEQLAVDAGFEALEFGFERFRLQQGLAVRGRGRCRCVRRPAGRRLHKHVSWLPGVFAGSPRAGRLVVDGGAATLLSPHGAAVCGVVQCGQRLARPTRGRHGGHSSRRWAA